MRIARLSFVALMLSLAACSPSPAPDAGGASKAKQDAAAADDLARQFDTAVAAENWTLARAQCDVLAGRYAQAAATQRLAKPCADARAKADVQAETARLQGLWTYQSQAVGRKQQVSASIYAKDPVDTGAGRSQVRLIFRDHPDWGRSSYLVLENGDFDCYGGCTLKLDIDGHARTIHGKRPDTKDAIAMFVGDGKALWTMIKGAKTVSITLPLKGARAQPAVFDVGGLDRSRMPGW